MTATTAEAKIASALLAKAEQVAGVLALPLAFPGVAFKPTVNAPFLQVSVMPNMADATGIEFGAPINHQGMLQISVFWPAGQGEVKPRDMAGRVIAAFARGTRIQGDGIEVRIERQPEAASVLTQSDRLQVPVTIRWRAVAPDPTA